MASERGKGGTDCCNLRGWKVFRGGNPKGKIRRRWGEKGYSLFEGAIGESSSLSMAWGLIEGK